VTVEGLDGLSIGRLAQITGVPKRSVHALFGSKEELQLATVNAARESFIREVVGPALAGAEPGRDRLLALCDGYLSYVQRRIFPEGCFFVAASAEVGARAGRVHDEVARVQQQWRDLLGREARVAADKGQLASDTDPAQLAFELGVILAGTNIVSVLHDDAGAIAGARGGPPPWRTSGSTGSAGDPRTDLHRDPAGLCLVPSVGRRLLCGSGTVLAKPGHDRFSASVGSGGDVEGGVP